MSGLLTPEQLAEAFASNDKAAIMGHIEAQGALLPTAAPGSYEDVQRKFGAAADAAKTEVLAAYPLASIACASVSGDRLMRRTWYIDADTTGKRISEECGTPEEAWISAGKRIEIRREYVEAHPNEIGHEIGHYFMPLEIKPTNADGLLP